MLRATINDDHNTATQFLFPSSRWSNTCLRRPGCGPRPSNRKIAIDGKQSADHRRGPKGPRNSRRRHKCPTAQLESITYGRLQLFTPHTMRDQTFQKTKKTAAHTTRSQPALPTFVARAPSDRRQPPRRQDLYTWQIPVGRMIVGGARVRRSTIPKKEITATHR